MKTNKQSNYFDYYIKVKFFFKYFFLLLLPNLPDIAFLIDKMEVSAAFSKTDNGGQRLFGSKVLA